MKASTQKHPKTAKRAGVPATGPLSPEEARKIIARGKRALTSDESNAFMEKLYWAGP
jgi:hypothetical protein